MNEVYIVVWESSIDPDHHEIGFEIQAACNTYDKAKEILGTCALDIIKHWDEFVSSGRIITENEDCFYIIDDCSLLYDKVYIDTRKVL